MSLRKVAGFLGAFGLAVGLVGGGVSAAWTDQVTAAQNITVANFSCRISARTPTAAVISADGKSLTYTAPAITSSAPGSAQFTFTVQNNGGTGAIPVLLTVEQTALAAPFSSILADPVAPVTLAANNNTKVYTAGIKWTELGNENIGQSVSITYTVHCSVPH